MCTARGLATVRNVRLRVRIRLIQWTVIVLKLNINNSLGIVICKEIIRIIGSTVL